MQPKPRLGVLFLRWLESILRFYVPTAHTLVRPRENLPGEKGQAGMPVLLFGRAEFFLAFECVSEGASGHLT